MKNNKKSFPNYSQKILLLIIFVIYRLVISYPTTKEFVRTFYLEKSLAPKYPTYLKFGHMSKIVKTQRNSTQLNATLKQLALELDIVVTCSTTPPPHAQTFQPLLDQLERWNLARPLTRPIWLTKHNFNTTNYWGGGVTNLSPRINPYNLIGTKIFF